MLSQLPQVCYEQERMARSINGEIVSESESEDPEQYVGVKSVVSEAVKTHLYRRSELQSRDGQEDYVQRLWWRGGFCPGKCLKEPARFCGIVPILAKLLSLFYKVTVRELTLGAELVC